MSGRLVYETIDQYLVGQPPETRAALASMRAWILEAAPEAEQLINYGIPAFALVKGGKQDEQIMIAGFARHVGFYPNPLTIEHFEDELAGYKHAKGSVQFPLGQPLPKDLIIRMVQWRQSQLEPERPTGVGRSLGGTT